MPLFRLLYKREMGIFYSFIDFMKGDALFMCGYKKHLENLSYDELRVFKLLEGLEPDERITGALIMARLGIRDRRHLYVLIENIRKEGLPIIGGKQLGEKGYKIARSKEELQMYLKACQTTINTQIRTMQAMQRFSDELFTGEGGIA